MELNTLIAECTAYDFKVMLEEKKPKSWLPRNLGKTHINLILISY